MSKHKKVSFDSETVKTVEQLPNGNAILTPEIANYVDRYKTFLVKTAESILGLAQTLVEAEATLDSVDFAIFCDNVGIETGGSTYTKLKKIGDAITRFQPFMDKLPNTWTTIYKLARLEPTDFDRVVAKLSPFITAAEIDQLVGVERRVVAKRSDLSIDLESLDTQQKAAFYAALQELKQKYGFSVSEKTSLIQELKSVKLAKAA